MNTAMQGFAINHDRHVPWHISHLKRVVPDLLALNRARRWLMWVGSITVLENLDSTQLPLNQRRLLVLQGVDEATCLEVADAALHAGINGAVFVDDDNPQHSQAWGMLFHPHQPAAQPFLQDCLHKGYRFGAWHRQAFRHPKPTLY